MKNITKNIIFISIFIAFFMPAISFAQCTNGGDPNNNCVVPTPVPDTECYPGKTPEEIEQIKNGTQSGLVKCGRKTLCQYQTTKDKDGKIVPVVGADGKKVIIKIADPDDACNFNGLLHVINNIIKYILLLALPIVAIMFAYGGFLLVTSGGDTSKRTKAKGIFFNAAIGLILAFTAYLIIMTILKTLGYNGTWIGF